MELKPLNVTSRKASINGSVYEVLDYNEYRENLKFNKDRIDIGVLEEKDGDQLLLPYRGEYVGDPISPGIYNAGVIDFVKYPDEITKGKYIPDRIISLSNTSDIKDIIEQGEAINKLDEPFVTTPNQITNVMVKDSDQPELKALKMAINAKHFDLDKYAGRFGANYPNDKRQLKSESITLNILKRFCNNCDMEALLTIRDKNSDIPNPMGKEITISLTEEYLGDSSDDENYQDEEE